jgi:hypothetical protein
MKKRRAVLVKANRPTLFELDLFLTRAGLLAWLNELVLC